MVGPFNVFDIRVSGTQSVFDLSSIRRFAAGRLAVQAAKAEAQGTRDQVTDQVTVLSRRPACRRRRNDRPGERRDGPDAGRSGRFPKDGRYGTGIEVTRANVQLANERQRLLVAGNERERARLQLMKTIGLKLDGAIELTDRMEFKAPDPLTAEQALKIARDERSELKAQQQREATARLSYSATKWERLPSVAFVGDYGSIGTGLAGASPTRTYGLSVRVPLFDGGRRYARREESLSQYRQEQIRTVDLRSQIELDIRVALDSVKSAEAQVAAAREGLELADRELAQARRRYEAGVASSIEV